MGQIERSEGTGRYLEVDGFPLNHFVYPIYREDKKYIQGINKEQPSTMSQ